MYAVKFHRKKFSLLFVALAIMSIVLTVPLSASAEPKNDEKDKVVRQLCAQLGYGPGVFYKMTNGGVIDADAACVIGYEMANGITGGFVSTQKLCSDFKTYQNDALNACAFGGTITVAKSGSVYVATSSRGDTTATGNSGDGSLNACNDYSNILTFPNWYRGAYTNGPGGCDLFPDTSVGINYVWVVVSNVIEILLQLVGYVAVGFIIFGGFKYLTSQGESSALASAKNTITQAIVGLVISIVSVLILNFVVGIFGLRTQGANLEITYSPQVQLLVAEREQRNV